MRKLILIATLCFFTLSKNANAQSNNGIPIIVFDSSKVVIDSVQIDFQTSFNQQLVKISYNNQTLFNKTITTNPVLDKAASVWVKLAKNENLIQITCGNDSLTINLKQCFYKYIGVHYSKKSKLFVNEASNKPFIYN